MLVETVHMHEFYECPADSSDPGLFCGSIVGILKDLCANGILLVDGEGRILDAINQAIDSWPSPAAATYGTHARRLLLKLYKDNRIVSIKEYAPHGSAANEACRAALGIHFAENPDALFVAANCRCGAECTTASERCLNVSTYGISQFESRRREFHDGLVLGAGGMSKKAFEDAVLRPVFRRARSVTIIDRYVGQVEDEHKPFRLADRYASGLSWVFQSFAKYSNPAEKREFTVATQIPVAMERASKEKARSLRSWAKNVSEEYGIVLQMDIRQAERGRGMGHDRFLVTDQVALHVSRGFDLLRPDGRLRDTTIRPQKDISEALKEVRRLAVVP